jgi:hypothetical protein
MAEAMSRKETTVRRGASDPFGRADDPRIVARIEEDGTLGPAPIPAKRRRARMGSRRLSPFGRDIEREPEYRHPPAAKPGRK